MASRVREQAATRVKVGLIVNPIAGMGGSVGLKGTDSAGILQQAIDRGAEPLAATRTARTLAVLRSAVGKVCLLVPSGQMGEEQLDGLGFEHGTVARMPATFSVAADTRHAASAVRAAGAAVILFAGGDGTARDLLAAVGESVPVIGIPCGVKMHSGVFATSPEAAGHLALEFIDKLARRGDLRDSDLQRVEVMDIDEVSFRAGRLTAQLFGYALCPRGGGRLQGPKSRGVPGHDEAVASAAAEIVQNMQQDEVYLVGPGTSAKAVLDALGIEGSLLGVDAVLDRALIGKDLSGEEIVQLAQGRQIRIILGVIGGQGYVLGRGNQQIGPEVVRETSRDGLIIVSSEERLAALVGERLLVDTGDSELDRALEGFVRVHTGTGRRMMMKLSAGQ